MSSIRRLELKNLLCIGTPTIHEAFNGPSHLLDIDRQFVSHLFPRVARDCSGFGTHTILLVV
jgi:hypothetical protein